MSFEEQLHADTTLEQWLQRKRDYFLIDYGIGDKPVIVWQCTPLEGKQVSVYDAALWKVLQEGANEYADTSWWNSFCTGRQTRLVFDGLSSCAPSEAPGHATEVHTDAHLVVGLWNFPEHPEGNGRRGSAICEFYADAFLDFAKLAIRVYGALNANGPLLASCTMVNGNQLPLIHRNDRVLAPAPIRTVLRWPLYRMDQGAAQMTDVAHDMAARFMRIYGRRPPARP